MVANTGHVCGTSNLVTCQLVVKTCHASSWLRSTVTGRDVVGSLSVDSTASSTHNTTQHNLPSTPQDIPIQLSLSHLNSLSLTLTLIQPTSMWMYWATLQCHSGLLRAAASPPPRWVRFFIEWHWSFLTIRTSAVCSWPARSPLDIWNLALQCLLRYVLVVHPLYFVFVLVFLFLY